MSVGLILVDIQNDYFPHGNMELEGSEQAGQRQGRFGGGRAGGVPGGPQ